MKNLLVLAVVALPATMSAHADVTLNGLFTDHMVLQREIPVAVYGAAEPGEKVTVAFSGQEKSATASKDGTWSVQLDAMKASTNAAVMTVTGKNKLEVKDMVIGDVWVCSGQSNMAWTQADCKRPDDIKEANFPLIRQFLVPAQVSSYPAADVSSSPVKGGKSAWAVCTPQSAAGFTAVGFYFGRKIHQETGIPIGLIKTAWGGTQVEPWCTPSGLATVPELAKDKEKLDKQMQEYRGKFKAMLPRIEAYAAESRKALDTGAELPVPIESLPYPISNREPIGWHCLYNGMINPLVHFGIKGVLWYQGESNGREGDSYFQKKRALIGGWRKAWNIGDFPFYFVQLANYQTPTDKPEGGDGWAKIRMAQLKTLTIPNTGMAVAIDLADVGNPGDIHPKNKKDVGERLALWSLAKDYPSTVLKAGGKAADIVYSGPLYRAMKIEEGKIRIAFDSVGTGLTAATKKGYDPMVQDPTGKLKKFAIAGEDKKWVWADAVIEGKTVVVSSPEVPKPVAVRYAFSGNPDGCNLYNNEGLPASPFRTDEW
jgi:sialate O-acetylesterase